MSIPLTAISYLLTTLFAYLFVIYNERKNRSGKSRLKQALLDDEIINVYQPLIDAKNSRIAGVEVLARWEHPADGLLGPATFIPDAERTGLIVDLAIQQLNRAMLELRPILLENPSLKVSFNVAGIHFESEQFLSTVEKVHQYIPNITLELTERDVLEEKTVTAVLSRMEGQGILIPLLDLLCLVLSSE